MTIKTNQSKSTFRWLHIKLAPRKKIRHALLLGFKSCFSNKITDVRYACKVLIGSECPVQFQIHNKFLTGRFVEETTDSVIPPGFRLGPSPNFSIFSDIMNEQ